MTASRTIFSLLGIGFLLVGSFAKINHWKYASELILVGFVCFFIFSLTYFINQRQKKKNKLIPSV